MAGRTTISGRGLVTSKFGTGLGIEKNQFNEGFDPYPSPTGSLSTSGASLGIGDAGVLVLSGTGEGVSGIIMPTVSSSVGSTFIFRHGGNSQHSITASLEGDGVLAFNDGTNVGSSLQIGPGVVGDSIAVVSDGVHFNIVGFSGSFTITGA